jgi:hypothetical protein
MFNDCLQSDLCARWHVSGDELAGEAVNHSHHVSESMISLQPDHSRELIMLGRTMSALRLETHARGIACLTPMLSNPSPSPTTATPQYGPLTQP